MDAPPSYSKRWGAGHRMETDLTLSDFEKSKTGGTPLSPGYRQYVFQPLASRTSTPARSDSPACRLPATSRTAARESPSQDDDVPGDAANALKYDAAASSTPSNITGVVARGVGKVVARIIGGASAAVGTHCRNIDVTMNDRLADMDSNAH